MFAGRTVNAIRLVAGLAAVAVLQGCGCTTYSNRLCVGHRPPVIGQLSKNDLRDKINPPLCSIGRALGFFTTPFKRAGVFGWKDMHIDAVVIGRVEQVATSTDHFVTADLCVRELTANGAPVDVDDERYLRAEICARRLRLAKAALPCAGDTIRITGLILWDGDGFLEIHPQRAEDVQILERNGDCYSTRVIRTRSEP